MSSYASRRTACTAGHEAILHTVEAPRHLTHSTAAVWLTDEPGRPDAERCLLMPTADGDLLITTCPAGCGRPLTFSPDTSVPTTAGDSAGLLDCLGLPVHHVPTELDLTTAAAAVWSGASAPEVWAALTGLPERTAVLYAHALTEDRPNIHTAHLPAF